MSVVVGDRDVIGITIEKPEAEAPLIVDADGELTLTVAFERVQPVSGRNP